MLIGRDLVTFVIEVSLLASEMFSKLDILIFIHFFSDLH